MPVRLRHGLMLPLLLLAACDAPETAQTSARPPTAVAVQTLAPRAIEQRIQALGTLLAKESIDITASVSEKITALHFNDGDTVSQGQLLATLAQQEEQALLAAAEADLAEQTRELARLEGLIQRKVAAQTEYDQRQTAKLQAQARIKEVQAMIAERTLTAPFAGQVGLRRVSPGALVTPGDIITTLDDTRVMRMDFQVPALYLSNIAPGQTVEAYSDALKQRFSGTITAIDSRVDKVARNINVRAELPNTDGLLKPGMLMRLSLITQQRQALMVMEQALQSIQDQHFVWVMDNKQTARKQQIELGLRQPGLIEASAGLAAGDQVIIEGYDMLRDGAAVTPLNDDTQDAN